MIDLRAASLLPVQKAATVAGTDICIEVQLDDRIAMLSVRSIGADGKVSFDAANSDGGALGAREYSTLPADVWVEINVRRDRRSGTAARTKYYITSATNGTRLEVVGEGAV